MPAGVELDAIVLADDPLSQVRIAGLPAVERASRVARKVGATRVLVVDGARDEILAWRGDRTCPLLVIRADQLVHTPLVAPLVEAAPGEGVAVAVGPDGSDAGAYLATGSAVASALASLARGDRDATFAGTTAVRIPHGEIARHPIGTPAERAAAHKLLYRILIKPQDNAITRYLFRPVSFPLTRMFVWTPITPNQISLLVAVLVAVGCWLTAGASFERAIAGTAVILVASYLDCCDGEVARLKLMSSRVGAWIDTIVDELSTLGYMVALGWHCHLHFGDRFGFDPWIPAIVLGLVTYGWSIYCIYYNIIVAVGSANSQDYVGRFDVVPGSAPSHVRLAPAAPKAIAPAKPLPPPLQWIATYLPYVIRRDFLAWATLVLAVAHLTHVSFAIQVTGGVISFVILTVDHVRLRRLRRSIARAGQILESPAA